MLSTNSSDFELIVRQQPERARVAGGKEKGTSFPSLFCWLSSSSSSFSFLLFSFLLYSPPPPLSSSTQEDLSSCQVNPFQAEKSHPAERKPVDPPPIIQLKVREDCQNTYLAQ